MWRGNSRTLICAACIVATALTVAVAPASWAARAPGATERTRIVAAIESAEETAAMRGRFDVKNVRISTVNTPSVRWGRARIEPKPGVQGDGARVIIGRFGHTWKVLDLGTSGSGCWLEKRVRRDLKIGDCS